jgi:hypothetical protein
LKSANIWVKNTEILTFVQIDPDNPLKVGSSGRVNLGVLPVLRSSGWVHLPLEKKATTQPCQPKKVLILIDHEIIELESCRKWPYLLKFD